MEYVLNVSMDILYSKIIHVLSNIAKLWTLSVNVQNVKVDTMLLMMVNVWNYLKIV